MKQLNDYIIEKLHLDDSDVGTFVKNDYVPKVGDNVLWVCGAAGRCVLYNRSIKDIANDHITIYKSNKEYMDLYFVDDEGLYFAEEQDSDELSFNIVIEKNLAIEYLEEFVKTRKGVVKFEYKGKVFRIIKDDNMPMVAYLEGIIDRLKD